MELNLRTPDDPRFKEPIIAELYSKFITYLEEQGLTKGKEFEGKVNQVFSCSQRYIHIFDQDESRDHQLVVYLCSTQFSLEFGIYNKKEKKVVYRRKLENLRYKISDFTEIELIDSHKNKFQEFFEDFKDKFKQLSSGEYHG